MYRFIVLAPNAWDGPYMNRQQIFSRVARRHWVLYSTGAVGRSDAERPRVSPATPPTRPGEVLVDRPSPWLRITGRVPAWNRWVVARTAARLKRLAGPPSAGPLVAYLFHPRYFDYVADLKPDVVVYHAYDLFSRYKGWSAETDRRQRALLERADIVVASSDQIAEALRTISPRRIDVVPNGVDYEAFAAPDLPVPSEVEAVPRPRIGYAGALSRKVDFALIIAGLAGRHPSWQFVLMGERRAMDEPTEEAYRAAAALTNVHMLPARSHGEVPGFVAAMDVNVMCYRLAPDLWVEAGYPLKLHECLASGRPAISADLPSVRPFVPAVAIAHTPAEWEAAIDAALRDTSEARAAERRAVARQNTWDARVANIEALVGACIAAPHPPPGVSKS